MPVYTEENEALVSQKRCQGVRTDLRACLEQCDCVKSGRKMKECLQAKEVPPECLNLATLMFECKRALLDNRQRFREKKGY